LLQRVVPKDELIAAAIALAQDLADKPVNAMRLTKQRFREMTQPGLDDMFASAARLQAAAYRSGEPQSMMGRFLKSRPATST
jgi:enoyl-CoA hydratase/carnithine racemase